MQEEQKDIINQLRKDILKWEGFRPPSPATRPVIGLKAIESAFPNGTFPTGTIHEFLNFEVENAAAAGGFIAALLAALMKQGGACIWVSTTRKLSPPSLKVFGVEADKIIFVDVKREKDVLWVMEEASKCEGLAAVIAEVRELSSMQSRRLQLAVETSKVTGFVLRSDPKKMSANACTARWQITPIASGIEIGMPGVGFPRWQIELLKIRNGRPGSWKVEWRKRKLNLVTEQTITFEIPEQIKKVG